MSARASFGCISFLPTIINGVALIRDTGCTSSSKSCTAGHGAGADVTRPVADAERVAVRRSLRGTGDADAGAGAGHGLDDDGLAERHPHALAQDARERVRRPAGGKRHDDGDRARRIALRMRASDAPHRNSQRRDNRRHSHGLPSPFLPNPAADMPWGASGRKSVLLSHRSEPSRPCRNIGGTASLSPRRAEQRARQLARETSHHEVSHAAVGNGEARPRSPRSPPCPRKRKRSIPPGATLQSRPWQKVSTILGGRLPAGRSHAGHRAPGTHADRRRRGQALARARRRRRFSPRARAACTTSCSTAPSRKTTPSISATPSRWAQARVRHSPAPG